MSIILNTKDADFVATYARENLNKVNTAYKASKEKLNEICELSTLISNLFNGEIPEKFKADKERLEDRYFESQTKLENMYLSEINKLNKIIDLMLCGSENK